MSAYVGGQQNYSQYLSAHLEDDFMHHHGNEDTFNEIAALSDDTLVAQYDKALANGDSHLFAERIGGDLTAKVQARVEKARAAQLAAANQAKDAETLALEQANANLLADRPGRVQNVLVGNQQNASAVLGNNPLLGG